MKIAFVFLPLAFNGPCISESGPKVMEFFLKKNNYQGDYYMFSLKWNESPKEYNERVLKELEKIEKQYSKILIFGGNHLSLLPVYELTETLSYNSLTLDAHRDYLLNDGMITHGSFLRFIKRKKVKRYILGFRDEIKKEDEYKFFDKEISAEVIVNNNMTIPKDNIIFVDIDVDVLDESIFPFTSCKKENGISLKKLYEILEFIDISNIKILSFSEYAYVLDKEKKGLEIIFSIIDKFIK